MSKLILILFAITSLSAFSQKTKFSRIYGTVNGDFAHGIAQASDSSLFICGSSESPLTGLQDYYLLKLDRAGNYVDQKIFGSQGIDVLSSIQKMPGGMSFLCTGYSNHSPNNDYNGTYLVADINGDTLWTKTIGGSDWDFLENGRILPDSGFIMCGTTFSNGAGGSDFWLVRTDKDGNVLWEKTYGGILNDEAYDVAHTTDNGFVVGGNTYNNSAGETDALLVKFDSLGNYQWHYQYGDTAADQFSAVNIVPDGRIIAAGYSKNGTNLDQLHVVGYNNGTLTNFLVFGSGGDDLWTDAFAYDNSTIALAGSTTSYGNGGFDYYLLVSDYGGYLTGAWPDANKTFGFAGNEEMTGALVTLDSGFVMVGNTNTFPGLSNIYIIKADTLPFVDPALVNEVSVNEHLSQKRNLKAFPNPTSGELSLITPAEEGLITISDLSGRMLYSSIKNQSDQTVFLNLSGYSAGLYLLSFYGSETGSFSSIRISLSR